MRLARNLVHTAVMALLESGAVSATKYAAPDFVVRATARRYRGRRLKGFPIDIALHLGRPNFAERKVIKRLRRVHQSFPVHKVSLRFAPVKKAR